MRKERGISPGEWWFSIEKRAIIVAQLKVSGSPWIDLFLTSSFPLHFPVKVSTLPPGRGERSPDWRLRWPCVVYFAFNVHSMMSIAFKLCLFSIVFIPFYTVFVLKMMNLTGTAASSRLWYHTGGGSSKRRSCRSYTCILISKSRFFNRKTRFLPWRMVTFIYAIHHFECKP